MKSLADTHCDYKISNCAASIVTAIMIVPALAYSGAAYSQEDTVLEQIVTTAMRSESDSSAYMGSISAIDKTSLDLTAHTHIQESLIRIPGVNLNRGNGQEYLPSVRSPVLTGAGACGGFLMAEDGIPLRAAGFCNINELFEAHSEAAQRIEVLRGPGTAFYGSNALHGVINVITPRPDTQDSSAGLEFGPYDYGRLKLSTSKTDGQRGVGLSLSLSHDGGYRDESGFDQQKISIRHYTESGNWGFDNGITVSNLNQETAGYITGLNAYKDWDISESNPNPEAYRDASSIRAWSRANREFADGSRLILTPYFRATQMNFLQHFLPGDPLEENGQKGVGFQSAYYFSPEEDLNLIVGMDGEFTQGYLKQSQDAPTQGSAFLQATIPEGKHYDYDVNASMVAPFAHISWMMSERWALDAGVRYESMHYDYTNNMVSGRTREDGTSCGFGGCRYTRPESRTDSFNNWSPKLSVSYQLADNHLAYLSLARGFRAPQATELYRLQRAQTVADLDSEQVDSVELGIKGSTASLSYAIAFYAMEKDNYIFRDSDFFNVSDGETDHQGVELEVFYKINKMWDVGVTANYAEHTYAYDQVLSGININGNDIDSAPRHFGSARIGFNFLPQSRAELEWQHMGSYYLEPENLHKYSGHNVLNLRVSWNPVSNWMIYGRIINVGDRAYAERADFTSFTDERYFPGMPRSFYAGVKWQW